MHCAAGAAWTAILLTLGGCSVKAPPLVGAVTITDAKGVVQASIASLPRGAAIYLDVTITQDVETLGADWTVTCGSALPEGTLPPGMVDTSCGTFVPNHTFSGPMPTYPGATGVVTLFTAPANIPKGGTVTILVHATSLPSSISSLTLTIT